MILIHEAIAPSEKKKTNKIACYLGNAKNSKWKENYLYKYK